MRKASECTGAFRPSLLRTVAIVAILTLACVPVCLLEVSPARADFPHPAALQTTYSSHIAMIQPGPAATWKGLRVPLECTPLNAPALLSGLPSTALHTSHPAGRACTPFGSRSVFLLKRQLQV
jgi:hypothetical protein